MPDLLGINHLTLSTPDLDQLVTYPADPRIAVIDVGGADHLMIVETATGSTNDLDPLGRAGWGLRLGTYAQLCDVRERILNAGWPVGPIETLPTQWTMTARDPDGRPVDIRVHR